MLKYILTITSFPRRRESKALKQQDSRLRGNDVKYIFLSIFLLFIASPSMAQEQAFFSMLKDIPLMAGLEELEDHTISFDKPEGRIIESSAFMHDISKSQVLNFYQASLPQFGWHKSSQSQFYRNNELLEISFEETNIVKIMIKPTL